MLSINFPPTLLSVGVHGPFVSPVAVPRNPNGFQLSLTKSSDWPVSGDVVSIMVEQASRGSNFITDMTTTLGGGPWVLKDGSSTDTSIFDVSAWGDNVITRNIRITLRVIQSCTIGIGLSIT